jgi:hypothetical protein
MGSREPAMNEMKSMHPDPSGEAQTPVLQVWRLHPRGARLEPADATLGGDAPLPGRQYCGPFVLANGAGYYLYSPVDMDISYDPREESRWTVTTYGEGYTDDDVAILRGMAANHPTHDPEMITPRTKIYFAGEHYEPRHTVQIWTGCLFRTPPGWSLWIRSPINREMTRPFQIMEGILETDWLWYDIWMNLRFTHTNVTASLRRDGPPLAQIVPVPRATTQHWQVEERKLAPDDPEAQGIFDRWSDYQRSKFHSLADGQVNRAVYHQKRREFGGQAEQDA